MDAINNPAPRGRRQREVSTTDMDIGQRPDIVLPEEGFIIREAEAIATPEGPIEDDELKYMKFMEEPVTILIHPSAEKNPEPLVNVLVNGVGIWVPVNREFMVARKYVEVLARAKSDNVQTAHDDTNVENPQNRIIRTTSSKYPFSVVNDPSGGNGYAWLRKIMAEG